MSENDKDTRRDLENREHPPGITKDIKIMAFRQSLMGDGCWLTRRQTRDTGNLKAAAEKCCRRAYMTILCKRRTVSQSPLGDPPPDLWYCNNQPATTKMMATKISKKPGISEYGRPPPMIDDTYNEIMATKVANAAVDRDPARRRSCVCADCDVISGVLSAPCSMRNCASSS